MGLEDLRTLFVASQYLNKDSDSVISNGEFDQAARETSPVEVRVGNENFKFIPSQAVPLLKELRKEPFFRHEGNFKLLKTSDEFSKAHQIYQAEKKFYDQGFRKDFKNGTVVFTKTVWQNYELEISPYNKTSKGDFYWKITFQLLGFDDGTKRQCDSGKFLSSVSRTCSYLDIHSPWHFYEEAALFKDHQGKQRAEKVSSPLSIEDLVRWAESFADAWDQELKEFSKSS